MSIYIGVDIGSVSTKVAAIDNSGQLVCYTYVPTAGNPISAASECFARLSGDLPDSAEIKAVCATGSGRELFAERFGADMTKNEITCQSLAAINYLPKVRTIFEIGGQDSKIITLKDGVVTDFGMNTICAAGTGSFLDHQARRLGLDICSLSEKAVAGKNAAPLSGRCTVFVESDMIAKQQSGYKTEDIIYGLCRTLASNYLNDVCKGKKIEEPIIFQGGVAFNKGMVRAFEEILKAKITLPPNPEITGALGACFLAREKGSSITKTRFIGVENASLIEQHYTHNK